MGSTDNYDSTDDIGDDGHNNNNDSYYDVDDDDDDNDDNYDNDNDNDNVCRPFLDSWSFFNVATVAAVNNINIYIYIYIYIHSLCDVM